VNSYEARQTIPSHIGHYEILSIIGRGGMGLVYLARDPRLDRQVAIKCLRTELFEEHYRERFKREALLLAKLNHPHIVQIYDFIESPEQLALVMEYVDGHNLQIHLREHLVTFAQRMQWLTQITQGLAIAHDAGIIHRDLKTENILINKRNIAKISDLGIAKSQEFNATITDHVAGSYCSMSPEQAMGEAINFKSDLFSLGILAYQLLCGAHPFGDTSNKLQVMQRIISHPPIPPTQNNPDLPAEIINLLGQLLAKNPDSRPDNTHWVAAQFEKLCQLLPTSGLTNDDTQALLPGMDNATNPSGIHTRPNIRNTNEHPTFDTSYLKAKHPPKTSALQKLYAYLKINLVSVTLIGLTLVIVGAVTVWQLQPKPPKYVAVVPPTLNSNDMAESQQELMKGAVYDAIQQSVIQLDGFYLIPRTEIADINGDIEMIRRATAADEIITTNIVCKINACTINLSRLTPEEDHPKGRLRVKDTKTMDVLTDNYLSTAEVVHRNLGAIYSAKSANAFDNINEEDYKKSLLLFRNYADKGATENLLNEIDKLPKKAKTLATIRRMYSEISLDLYYETRNPSALTRLEEFRESISPPPKDSSDLIDAYYLQIAKKDFASAQHTANKLLTLNGSHAIYNQLLAYAMLEKNNYAAAIQYYTKSLIIKKSADTLVGISNAYRYLGDTETSKKFLLQAINLSPNNHKIHSLYGLTALVEGDIEQALKSFELVIEKNPNDISNLNSFGLTNMLNKNYAQALTVFQQAYALDEHNTTLLLNIADSHTLLKDKQQSQKSYLAVIDAINPSTDNNEDLRNLAQAHAHLNQFGDALTTLKKLEKADPENIETFYTAALVHALAKNNTSSILNTESALEKGMHAVWFSFPWFNSLCKEVDFVALLNRRGEASRCLTP
jgi:serine/threonine-protein kinase